MFKLLKRGRVKLIVADNLSFYSTGEAAQQVDYLKASDVEVALPYRASLGYITFWPPDPAVIQRWQRELDAMKPTAASAASTSAGCPASRSRNSRTRAKNSSHPPLAKF